MQRLRAEADTEASLLREKLKQLEKDGNDKQTNIDELEGLLASALTAVKDMETERLELQQSTASPVVKPSAREGSGTCSIVSRMASVVEYCSHCYPTR